MDLWDYSPIITSYNLYWLVFSTPLKNMIIIIIPYYTILSNTPPTSAAFGFSQSQSKSRLPSRPQSSPVVPSRPRVPNPLSLPSVHRLSRVSNVSILKGRPQKDGKRLIYTEWI